MFNSRSIASILLLICGLASCEHSTTPQSSGGYEYLPPPSRDLTAKEIMQAEGIQSIHFVESYFTILNGDSDKAFQPAFEYFIDTSRIKMKQYYFDNPDWNTSVYDLNKNRAWNYYSGQLTYQNMPDLRWAYEQYVQSRLGSWLKTPTSRSGLDLIESKYCDRIGDSTTMEEWIWRGHRIPIQRRSESYYDGLHQITYVRKCQIEINPSFPDSLFDPPK